MAALVTLYRCRFRAPAWCWTCWSACARLQRRGLLQGPIETMAAPWMQGVEGQNALGAGTVDAMLAQAAVDHDEVARGRGRGA